MVEATRTKPMKLRAVFSYLVATRRYSFALRQKHSAKLRSLYRSGSYARRSLRVFSGGITFTC